MLYVLEFKKWVRSKRLFLLCGLFIFVGFISTIVAYYQKDILKALSSANTMTIVFAKPNWRELICSYFKSCSQIMLMAGVYMGGISCILGNSFQLRSFYLTKTTSKRKIFMPKIITSLICMTIGMICGDLSALYVVRVLFNNLNWKNVMLSMLVQLLSFVVLNYIGIIISICFNNAFAGAGIIELFIIIATFLQSLKKVNKWTLMELLNPQNLINNGANNIHFYNDCIVILLTVISGILLLITIPKMKVRR